MLSLHNIVGRCWAIRGEIATHIQREISAHGIAALRELAAIRAGLKPEAAARGRAQAGSGAIAVIPVVGTMTQRGDTIDCQETLSTDAVAEQIKAFAADPNVDAIVLEFDSPGGEVSGVPEAAAVIRQVRATKPVVAFVHSMAASAGYWLASACDEIWGTVSSSVGSIGVYAAHQDISAALEAEGVKVTLVSAGKYKTEGNELQPLDDDARAAIQSDVNRFYGMFTADVAKGRRVSVDAVRGGFGEGRMVGMADAVRQGMADGVGTFEQVVRRVSALVQSRKSGTSARADATITLPVADEHVTTEWRAGLDEDDVAEESEIERRIRSRR